MIDILLTGILKFVIYAINLILFPINALISTYMPSLNDALNGLGSIFDSIGSYIGWILEALCLESYTITLLVLVSIFRLTLPLLIHIFKIVVQWYDKLKV